MLQPLLAQNRPIQCFRHKKQQVTHLCCDIKCNNNPILCPQCIAQGLNRSYHYDHHEKYILPISEAIDLLCDTIRGQASPISRIYKATLGRNQFAGVAGLLEKGNAGGELEGRIQGIKAQVELQIELLVKQFQKILLLQKQQYFKLLENYQKTFQKNLQHLKQHTQPITDFQSSIKYYTNKNNFYLKMAAQINRKSDWLVKTKKSLQLSAKTIQSVSYSSELNNLLTLSNRIKLDAWPQWKGEENADKGAELRFVIKRAIAQWAFIPEAKSLEAELESGVQIGQNNSGLGKNYYTLTQLNGK